MFTFQRNKPLQTKYLWASLICPYMSNQKNPLVIIKNENEKKIKEGKKKKERKEREEHTKKKKTYKRMKEKKTEIRKVQNEWLIETNMLYSMNEWKNIWINDFMKSKVGMTKEVTEWKKGIGTSQKDIVGISRQQQKDR